MSSNESFLFLVHPSLPEEEAQSLVSVIEAQQGVVFRPNSDSFSAFLQRMQQKGALPTDTGCMRLVFISKEYVPGAKVQEMVDSVFPVEKIDQVSPDFVSKFLQGTDFDDCVRSCTLHPPPVSAPSAHKVKRGREEVDAHAKAPEEELLAAELSQPLPSPFSFSPVAGFEGLWFRVKVGRVKGCASAESVCYARIPPLFHACLSDVLPLEERKEEEKEEEKKEEEKEEKKGCRRAVLGAFDIDFTLIRPREHRRFPSHPRDMELVFEEGPGRLAAFLAAASFRPFLGLLSNQSGIRTGQCTAASVVERVEGMLGGMLGQTVPGLGEAALVFFAPSNDFFRKPSVGMMQLYHVSSVVVLY